MTAVPVPDRVIGCTPAMDIVPSRRPVAVGLKVTVIVQCVLVEGGVGAGRTVPHVWADMAKSVGFVPPNEVVMFRSALPVLEMVTVCPALVVLST